MEVSEKTLVRHLQNVGYYRLSGYWYIFREKDAISGIITDDFRPDTSFRKIWRIYRFDRKLRFLLIDAIERIEVALRTRLVQYFSENHGPFAYANCDSFPKWKEHSKTIKTMEIRAGMRKPAAHRSKGKIREQFIKHFTETYCNAHLPMWMAVELMDFGTLSFFITHSDRCVKKKIADDLDIPVGVFDSWMRCLNTVRNTCAHHCRVWNRTWGTAPQIPGSNLQPNWYFFSDSMGTWTKPIHRQETCQLEQNKTGIILFICRYLLKIFIPRSKWHNRVNKLFADFSDLPTDSHHMGLPFSWKTHPLWMIK